MSLHVVGAYARAGVGRGRHRGQDVSRRTPACSPAAGRSWCGSRNSRARSRRREAAGAAHDLLVIARTEALIADLGLDEALKRGAAYAEAGADLLLVHSKRKTPDEIVAFTEAWPGTIPLTLVPTAYPDLTEAKVRALGKIAIVIYANHAIRAAVGAMREVFAAIRATAASTRSTSRSRRSRTSSTCSASAR